MFYENKSDTFFKQFLKREKMKIFNIESEIKVNLNVEILANSKQDAIDKFSENYKDLIQIYCGTEIFSVCNESVEIETLSDCEEVDFEYCDDFSKNLLLNANLDEMSKSMNDIAAIELSSNNLKFIENLYVSQLKSTN